MANPTKQFDELQGNYSNEFLEQRKEADKELFNFSELTSKPPTWLPSSAKTEWERVEPLLKKDFPISESDYSLLISYVLLFARIKTCEDNIRKYGTFIKNKSNGQRKPNPAINVQSQAIRDLKSIATSLGMTLEARHRLAINKAKNETPTDKFEELLNGS